MPTIYKKRAGHMSDPFQTKHIGQLVLYIKLFRIEFCNQSNNVNGTALLNISSSLLAGNAYVFFICKAS